jgi:hypothetical protein
LNSGLRQEGKYFFDLFIRNCSSDPAHKVTDALS